MEDAGELINVFPIIIPGTVNVSEAVWLRLDVGLVSGSWANRSFELGGDSARFGVMFVVQVIAKVSESIAAESRPGSVL